MAGQEARGEEGKQEEETPVPLSLSSFVLLCENLVKIFDPRVKNWGYRGQYFASGTPGMHQTDGNPAEVRNFLVFCSVCISPVAHGHHDVHAGEFCCV